MTNRLAAVEPSPDVFAAVMATGVLSVAAENHHYPGISETTGVLASLGLLVLVALVLFRRRSVRWDLHDPDVTLRLFTFVARVRCWTAGWTLIPCWCGRWVWSRCRPGWC
ncbi:TDT family transporter [Mycobacterium sp. HUMS_1102779]|uniref:hypothetical protein n=1 Tax=Mycobacterium sp. HUMS_1102779 TaxID=3383487 RepID=UPI00389AF8EA